MLCALGILKTGNASAYPAAQSILHRLPPGFVCFRTRCRQEILKDKLLENINCITLLLMAWDKYNFWPSIPILIDKNKACVTPLTG